MECSIQASNPINAGLLDDAKKRCMNLNRIIFISKQLKTVRNCSYNHFVGDSGTLFSSIHETWAFSLFPFFLSVCCSFHRWHDFSHDMLYCFGHIFQGKHNGAWCDYLISSIFMHTISRLLPLETPEIRLVFVCAEREHMVTCYVTCWRTKTKKQIHFYIVGFQSMGTRQKRKQKHNCV